MRKTKLLFLSTLTMLTMGLVATSAIAAKENVNPIAAYSNVGISTYYSGIDVNDTGAPLLEHLQALNKTKRQTLVGYGNMPSVFTQTDPGSSSGEVTSFYSGRSARYSGNMNREHVWPASRTVLGRDNDPLEDDIHMVRPTLKSENSSRGNKFFAESGAWDPASFNNESYRGDAARIIFYCIVADPQLKLVDKTSDSTANHSMGKLSDLVKWHLKYTINSRETVRNDAAERLQGNRNPFIDHPEYVCRIWGKETPEIYNMCLYNDPYDVPEGGNDPAPAKGCGGNIYTTSIVLSSLSLIGVGLLLIKRFKEEK